MQNKLKEATNGIIQTLNQANIRTIMATGDNVLTAISVGRQCNIVDAETEVFLGDVVKRHDREEVMWKSTKNEKHRLNRKTLEPNKEFLNDPNRKLSSGKRTFNNN